MARKMRILFGDVEAVAVRIPWQELSVAFEGVRTVHAGYENWLVE